MIVTTERTPTVMRVSQPARRHIPLLTAIADRILLSRAKHRSLAGHARISLSIARRLPNYRYSAEHAFVVDGAPTQVGDRRRAGFERLAEGLRARSPHGASLTREAAEGISDLQFTERYRVPFQFSDLVRAAIPGNSMLRESAGSELIDVDGNRAYDLAGSYGLNVFGYEFYKACLDDAYEATRALGPVLGAYQPHVIDVVNMLLEVSGQEEVSFHMSGTEAVMQAVRLARYHTGRRKIVRFCGAYHGFWGDVQPGVGNPMPAPDTLTLSDLSERTLRVIRTRDDIACVLVNPLQALHPNRGAPGDSGLMDSSRAAALSREQYTVYLRRLREICSARGIALIFDEVFLGFRLARGGAQEFFGVSADLVTYGKTLGGGLPIGVVCGKARFMRRFRADAPADVCFARGTFNAHPLVIAAAHAFLRRVNTPRVGALYAGLDQRWNVRAQRLNAALGDARLPVRVANFSSIWTVNYLVPSRYNWMFQFYLRAEGIHLSWVGTGRLIFQIDMSDADFDDVCGRFVRAARHMDDDGFWWHDGVSTNGSLRRRVSRELIRARLGF